MSQGLQVFNADGSLALDISDTLFEYVLSGTTTVVYVGSSTTAFGAYYSFTKFIAVTGMVPDGTWLVVGTNMASANYADAVGAKMSSCGNLLFDVQQGGFMIYCNPTWYGLYTVEYHVYRS